MGCFWRYTLTIYEDAAHTQQLQRFTGGSFGVAERNAAEFTTVGTGDNYSILEPYLTSADEMAYLGTGLCVLMIPWWDSDLRHSPYNYMPGLLQVPVEYAGKYGIIRFDGGTTIESRIGTTAGQTTVTMKDSEGTVLHTWSHTVGTVLPALLFGGSSNGAAMSLAVTATSFTTAGVPDVSTIKAFETAAGGPPWGGIISELPHSNCAPLVELFTYLITYEQRSTADPYSPGGTSEPAVGDGTFDFSSEPVDFQSAPTIGAYDTGMVSMYVPSAADLRSLAAYLWAGPFDPNNFRKLVADPMDAIIGLSILPLTAAEIGTTAATLEVGNVSTGLSMPLASRQYVVVDCGTVNVLPKWGAYLDFSPYSKLQLFLPYIGYVDISPDDCMNGTISVRYTVDLLSGTCVVQVKCQDHVLYEFAGTCSCSCPVTAGQYQNIVTSALKLGGALMSSVTSLGGALGALDDVANTAVSAAKPAISRSGGFGGSSGLMGHQVPYLILTVPRMCTPGDQDQMIGYPSYVTKTLGDLSGYVQVDTIHLAGIPASRAEQEEIVSLLHEGVYL